MKTKKQRIINGIFVAVMLVLSLFFLFPVIWMIANSFKQDAAITADMNSVRAFVPPAPGKGFFDNYKEILFNTSFLRYMLNTLFYAAILIVAGVIVNGLAGYALAKIKFPFRDRWLAIIMMLMIGLNSITSNDNTTMGQTLAVITLITIPVIIIYALFSKQIVEGVVSTGSKEG